MIVSDKMFDPKLSSIIHHFPFDVIKFVGVESVDFLQRITTNDFARFVVGNIQKTLLVTDKGRILDAVWVLHRRDHLLMLTSEGMASQINNWLNKYIIMEDIVLSDVGSEFGATVYFENLKDFYKTDYFGFPISIEIDQRTTNQPAPLSESFEQWRIENGIPRVNHELVSDFNPLELNLWNWISFTKGCYIGQEIIARLDTYNKIQRTLCLIESKGNFRSGDILIADGGAEIGKITSVLKIKNNFIGLAVIRVKFAIPQQSISIKGSASIVSIEKVFQKEEYGRN